MRVQSRSGKAEKLKKDLDALNLEVHQKNARVKMLDDLEKNMEGYPAVSRPLCVNPSAVRCAAFTARFLN
jgi:hypothetical protein